MVGLTSMLALAYHSFVYAVVACKSPSHWCRLSFSDLLPIIFRHNAEPLRVSTRQQEFGKLISTFIQLITIAVPYVVFILKELIGCTPPDSRSD